MPYKRKEDKAAQMRRYRKIKTEQTKLLVAELQKMANRMELSPATKHILDQYARRQPRRKQRK